MLMTLLLIILSIISHGGKTLSSRIVRIKTGDETMRMRVLQHFHRYFLFG